MNIKHIDMVASSGGYTKLTMIVDSDRTILGELVEKAKSAPDKYEVEIIKRRHKRGLTANAYYWVLVEKLSKILGSSKQEVHEEMIRRYGTFKLDADGKPLVFSLAAGKDPKGVTPYSTQFAEGMVNGKRFIHYAVLMGSSEMNNKQFAELLDGLISECKEMNIEVMTPLELAQLEYEQH